MRGLSRTSASLNAGVRGSGSAANTPRWRGATVEVRPTCGAGKVSDRKKGWRVGAVRSISSVARRAR